MIKKITGLTVRTATLLLGSTNTKEKKEDLELTLLQSVMPNTQISKYKVSELRDCKLNCVNHL